ncbi:MAG: iron ABC transporter substrate-binding protein [Desulforhopalus sp.]|nr:iron ABC transporter substrate-binding protein [Desulforhopalus sp.]
MPMLLTLLVVLISWPSVLEAREITDALGRTVVIPEAPQRVICSGSGCLRLLTYLQGEDLVVAVDDIEGRRRQFDARPYALANPGYKALPVFGEFRGKDNPELILTLDPSPELIFKLVGTGRGTTGVDPQVLQEKTGIPVVSIKYGNFINQRDELYQAIRLMGEAVGRVERAEEVIAYFDAVIADLAQRTADIPDHRRPRVYIGGVAYAGPHGFQSTEPSYPPFLFANAGNLAGDASAAVNELSTTDIAKEKIVEWDPDYLFLDLSTLQLGDRAGGLHELKTDPAYRQLTAVKAGRVYGMLPYNWYNQNYESILANAFFVGKLLYPERFVDIDPAVKADEIYTFLVGQPVFAEMNRIFHNLIYQVVPVE